MIEILTKREMEILKLVVKGYSNEKIGKELFITHHTVKFHLEKIYRKLGCHNKLQASMIAYKKGIVDFKNQNLPE